MKKENIVNLIKYYIDKNDMAFKDEAYEIAREFHKNGDSQLSEYILTMIQDNNFVPQTGSFDSKYLTKIAITTDPLLLPDAVQADLLGIGNAINKANLDVNKFLFSGKPGSGKTEAAKQLGRILNKDVYCVEISEIIDSKLGQTQKNIDLLFKEINKLGMLTKCIILFDEIDALALDRINSNDLREMGRATTELLKGLDNLNKNIILIATTNLRENMDKALLRRFDFIIDFNRYSREDLVDVADKLLDYYLNKYKLASRDIKTYHKIMDLYEELPYPAELKNIIKTSIAFCNPEDGKDYLKNLYKFITGRKPENIEALREEGFTVREIESLIGKSKSSIARELSNK